MGILPLLGCIWKIACTFYYYYYYFENFMLFISRPSRDKVASANVMSPVPSGARRDHGMLVGRYVLPTAYHLVAHGNTACRYNNSFRPALGACCMFMTMLLTTSYLSKTGKHKVILKIKPKSKVKCYYDINFSFLRLFLPSLPLPTPLCVCMYVCAHMHFLMDVL